MSLDDLGKIFYSDIKVCLWCNSLCVYRGEFSKIPAVILHYPVSLIKPVDSMLYIYLE